VSELPRRSLSVTGIVLRDDGQVLAIQRREDSRRVPAGRVLELDAPLADGVSREIPEETGIKVRAEPTTLPGDPADRTRPGRPPGTTPDNARSTE
jgi:8-oxo-dGTP diphosphatase